VVHNVGYLLVVVGVRYAISGISWGPVMDEIAQFLHSWYAMHPGVRKLSYLRQWYAEFPYSGYAYRVVEGQVPYVKSPVSWCKTLPAIRKYLKLSSSSDWEGTLVYAKLPLALDLSEMARQVLLQEKGNFRAREIGQVSEVVSLVAPRKVQMLARVLEDRLHFLKDS
jgi:hypothetical protein